jgi:hypothetical protein
MIHCSSGDPTRLLSLVTVVIFTYDRPSAFALRIASHLRDTGARILVMHNGPEPWRPEDIAKLSQTQTYHFARFGYSEQFALVASLLMTPYAVRADDDNMLLPSGLVECVRKLESRSNLIGVTPRSVVFWVNGGKAHFARTYTENDSFALEHSSPRARVLNMLTPQHVLGWYAVQRSEVFGNLTCLTAKIRAASSCPYATEVAEEIGYAWLGYSSTVHNYGVFRSLECPPLTNSLRPRSLSFTRWWTDPIFEKEASDFLEILRNHFSMSQDDLEFVSSSISQFVSENPEAMPSFVGRAARAFLPTVALQFAREQRAKWRPHRTLLEDANRNEVEDLFSSQGFSELERQIESIY